MVYSKYNYTPIYPTVYVRRHECECEYLRRIDVNRKYPEYLCVLLDVLSNVPAKSKYVMSAGWSIPIICGQNYLSI